MRKHNGNNKDKSRSVFNNDCTGDADSESCDGFDFIGRRASATRNAVLGDSKIAKKVFE